MLGGCFQSLRSISGQSQLAPPDRVGCATPLPVRKEILKSTYERTAIDSLFSRCTPLARCDLPTEGEGNVQILHPYGPDKLAGSMEIVPGVSDGRPLPRSTSVSLTSHNACAGTLEIKPEGLFCWALWNREELSAAWRLWGRWEEST